MENGHFRHVSVGALLLAACALLAAVISAASVVASEVDYRAVKENAAQIMRIQGNWPDHATLGTLRRPAVTRLSAATAMPGE